MPLAAFLMALVGPLARQILVSLGIGLITFVGLDAAVSAGLSAAKGALGGMTGGMVAIAARAGMFTAMSIIAGGMVARISLITVKKMGRLA
ncbi:DUF2523 family protein [Ralstonia insidiosa]|uniref:DUF2523 family protein n=1 Tax=Ralstonia insidiosa TaxID=190721 RepID=UPI001FC995FC|nr:DUF2523 family protein [Ralstonia insidiosa]